jgi:hypothetical protein
MFNRKIRQVAAERKAVLVDISTKHEGSLIRTGATRMRAIKLTNKHL